MTVLMVGVDRSRRGGMWSVVENYLNDKDFCRRINLIYIPTATFGSIPRRLVFSAKSFWSIYKLMKHQKVDIVHIHMAEKGSVFRKGVVQLMAKRAGCKTILHMHGADFESWYLGSGPRIRSLVRKILDRADRILILGHYLEPFVKSLLSDPDKTAVLYNSVEVPPENPYRSSATKILFLGVPIQRKGIFDLLSAFQILDGELPPEYQLMICGADDGFNSGISSRIKELRLENRVVLKGWIGKEEKSAVFGQTCVNVLPSYHEGLPMTILETMAFGIPNISTNVAAIPEIVEDGKNGVLIEPGNVEDLARAIQKLVLDRDLREKMSESSFRKIESGFSIGGHMDRLLNLYRELLTE